jgi:hypothetical protein
MSERDFIDAIQAFNSSINSGSYSKPLEVNFLSFAEKNVKLPQSFIQRNGAKVPADVTPTADSFVQNLIYMILQTERP